MVNIAGMSETIFFHGGQHCRNVIKKTSCQGWSTSPEQVVTMDQNQWSRWIGIYTNDSIFKSDNYRLFNYAVFADMSYNQNPLNNFLIKCVEKWKLINKNNSKRVNYLYSIGYINQLAANNKFDKIDSLLKYDTLISVNKTSILNNPFFKYLKAFYIIKKSFTLANYLNLKNEIIKSVNDGSITSVTSADIIEYATYFDDIPFADSLLNKYELQDIEDIKNFDFRRFTITDFRSSLHDYYLERSYITLYNKTKNNSYLVRLLKFKLLKDNFIKSIFSFNHINENGIDSIHRLLLRDDAIKSFKYITNTFDFPKDFNYFESRKTKYNLLIDSLQSNITLPSPAILDSDSLFNDLINNLNDSTIILLGLASRKNPLDTVLSTYVLLIEHDLNKLKLIEIEDSLFNTPIGNYFAPTPFSYTEKDKFKYLISNLNKSYSIRLVKHACKNMSNIFITGSALIDQIPFNVALSANSNTSKRIYEVCNLAELSTTIKSKFENDNKLFSKNNILCLGGVDFNTENSSLTRSLFNYLPGTLEEVDFIKNKFKNNYSVTLLKGSNATKSKLIDDLRTSSFKIIHLATHSFYVEFDPSKNPFVKIPVSILPQRELRSSILLSEGDEFENYESIDRLKNFLDKNLTLGEIMYLPLKQTNLVVLSSCETNIGLPQVYDDIFGNLSLNVAFKYAGAKYVIGTRWEVSDQYSKQFYNYFYSYLKQTNDVELSYSKAIQDLKLLNNDPFIWGTFILTM